MKLYKLAKYFKRRWLNQISSENFVFELDIATNNATECYAVQTEDNETRSIHDYVTLFGYTKPGYLN